MFDLPALRKILGGIQTRELDLVEVETASASPFASSLLFDYVATYMYEDDTPPEERRAQALSLDRGLLRELMGVEELRELLDAGAVADVEASLRPHASERGRAARSSSSRRAAVRGRVRRRVRGDAAAGAARAPAPARRPRAAARDRGRGSGAGRAGRGTAGRRAAGVPRAGARRAGRPSPAACAHERAVHDRARRRRGSGSTQVSWRRELTALERDEKLVRGELRPGGTEREWCDPDVLRRIRRATLATLRREVEPAEQASLGRFLPAWHGIGRRQSLREALVPLQALALPVSLWESDVLPRRVPGYRPADLDALCASGDVVWVGAGSRPGRGLLPRRRGAARAACERGRTRRRRARRDPRRSRPGGAVLGGSARRDRARAGGRARRRSGISSGPRR